MKKTSLIALSVLVFQSIVVGVPAQAAGSALGEWFTLTFCMRPSLYQADKTAGGLTLVGTADQDIDTDPLTGVAGFDVDATNNKAYFVTYGNVPGALWEVDLNTGAFSYIADTTSTVNGAALDVGNITAFDLGNNGEAWIAADNFGFGKVDLATGEVTLLIDDFTFPWRIHALATSPDGQLYAFDQTLSYYTIDPVASPATITRVGSTGVSVKAADFDADGTVLMQTYGGQLSKLTLADGTTNVLFTMSDNGASIGSEGFAVGGPTDGQTLTEALAVAQAPVIDTPVIDPAPVPNPVTDPVIDPVPTVPGPVESDVDDDDSEECHPDGKDDEDDDHEFEKSDSEKYAESNERDSDDHDYGKRSSEREDKKSSKSRERDDESGKDKAERQHNSDSKKGDKRMRRTSSGTRG